MFKDGKPSPLATQANSSLPAHVLEQAEYLFNRGLWDNLHQDAATMGRDVACVARRIDLCPVDIVSPTSRLFGEAECARFVGGGGGFVSKANAPIKLTASVASADWRSSEPMPVAGIEVQIVMGGNVSLANFQVIATIKETLK